MVPIGSGNSGEVKTLNKDQVVEYINIIRKEQLTYLIYFLKLKYQVKEVFNF